MSAERVACSALDAQCKCKNGFPVTGACYGTGGSTPICCNETVCGRIYPKGQPTATPAAPQASAPGSGNYGQCSCGNPGCTGNWSGNCKWVAATPAAQDGGQGQAEREAFEADYLRRFRGPGALGRDKAGNYGHLVTQARWEGWQAARSAPRPVLTELRNISEITQTSDMTVTVSFMSCRSAGAFKQAIERAVREGGGNG